MTKSRFVAKYGRYYENEKNSLFLANGIIGIVSRLAHLFKENYAVEIATN
jgi:hypothetical protein